MSDAAEQARHGYELHHIQCQKAQRVEESPVRLRKSRAFKIPVVIVHEDNDLHRHDQSCNFGAQLKNSFFVFHVELAQSLCIVHHENYDYNGQNKENPPNDEKHDDLRAAGCIIAGLAGIGVPL